MERARAENILLVSNFPSDIGYAWWLMEHFWVLLAQHFDSRNGKAFLAYPSINNLPETIRSSTITPVELTIPGSNKLHRKETAEFIKANNIRHVYLTDRPWCTLNYITLRMAGVRNIVVHDHTPGDRPPTRGVKGFAKAIRNRLPLICADNQLCVSDLMRQRSIENARIPADHCHVVQNGIPPVNRSDKSRCELLDQLGISSDSKICITTGRAHSYKRFDFIVDTASELQQLAPDNNLIFLLIGDGPAYSSLVKKVARLGLEKKVCLPGFRSDAKDLLGAADMAMHAALGEGFSLSIVEYMSAGLPVLVPDIPSVKQAIDHELNGFVYLKDSATDAANFINRLLQDQKTTRTMGLRAQEKASTRYSLENCTHQFQAVCQDLF